LARNQYPLTYQVSYYTDSPVYQTHIQVVSQQNLDSTLLGSLMFPILPQLYEVEHSLLLFPQFQYFFLISLIQWDLWVFLTCLPCTQWFILL